MRKLLDMGSSGQAVGNVYISHDREERVVWVTTDTVQASWDSLARTYQAKPHQITDAIKQLSKDKDSTQKSFHGKRKRAWPVPEQAFIDAAIADADYFKLEQ